MKRGCKYTLALLFLALAASALTACAADPAQRAMGMSGAQYQALGEHLIEIDIELQSAQPSENALLADMASAFEAYDIRTVDGEERILLLAAEDKSFVALLDTEGNLLNGMIDNTIFPDLARE